MDKKVAILLTGTVKPDNMTHTKIQDAEIRMNQYIDSIRFWLRTAKLPVIFVENSDTNLSQSFKQEIAKGSLEVLSFDGNNFDKRLGKGYGELNCLEYALANSKFYDDADFIFKITGRYKVLNFINFFKNYTLTPDIDLIVDFKWNLSFCDSRFFGFVPSFINDFLLDYRSIINDSNGIFFEHILAKASLTAIANGYNFKPLVTLPRIEGYSASSGVKYNSNYLHWLRYKFNYDLKFRSFELGNLPWI